MKNIIKQGISEYKDRVEAICHQLYENPEPALKEFNSSKIIKELLVEDGFEMEENCSGLPTAFKATKKNGTGPRVAIMVEYDSLPEIGHACGHHLITGMSLLAGISLAKVLQKYEGEVTLFGTPAEETGEGKPCMVNDGYFDDYDIGIMLHPFNQTCAEPIIASIGVYDIKFTGKVSHAGAAPEDGVNALDAVVMMYNGVSMMRQQMKDGTRICGIVLSGGNVTNSIPDECTIRYEIRTIDMEYYEHVAKRLKLCAEGAATATGCTMDWKLSMPICASLVPSPLLVNEYKNILDDMGIERTDKPTAMGSTDMGEVNEVIPTLHPLVKLVENMEPIHTEEFLKAANKPYAWEKMPEFAETLALVGLRVFEDPQLLMELRAEREEKRKKRSERGL